jgi:hypothetical protein
MILKIFLPKKSAKKWRFWFKTKVIFSKKIDHNIGFREKRQNFAKIENFDHNIDPRSDVFFFNESFLASDPRQLTCTSERERERPTTSRYMFITKIPQLGIMADDASSVRGRVARWFVFKPKIQIWVNFVGSRYGKSCYILWPFGLF